MNEVEVTDHACPCPAVRYTLGAAPQGCPRDAPNARRRVRDGADFLVLPIMGDHRADRWSAGPLIHRDDRGLAIMRTRAMDNQLCLVVARNCTQASCIVDRKGDLLAWNDGSEDTICADVDRGHEFRVWNGGCFLDVNWLQRRPHLYGAFVDEGNVGSLGKR